MTQFAHIKYVINNEYGAARKAGFPFSVMSTSGIPVGCFRTADDAAQAVCDHDWDRAELNGKPARGCELCGAMELLDFVP